MTALQFIGPFQFCQEMIKVMTHGGSIIQISSATATIMLNDHAAYMGAKAGTDHVIRCVANEFGKRGIRANSTSPGLTETPMTADAKQVPGLFECFRERYPLGRIGTSEDVAAAAVWLASDECYMTGENLQVNGGLTLRRKPTGGGLGAAVGKAGAAHLAISPGRRERPQSGPRPPSKPPSLGCRPKPAHGCNCTRPAIAP